MKSYHFRKKPMTVSYITSLLTMSIFSGNEKKESAQLLIIFPLSFYQFSHTLFGLTPYFSAKPYTFWHNYRLLPYFTFAKSFILFREITPEQKFTHSQM